jgi:hypothetical protein
MDWVAETIHVTEVPDLSAQRIGLQQSNRGSRPRLLFHRAHAGRRDRPGLGREFHPREDKTVDDGNGQITVIRRRRGELVNLTTKLNGAHLGVT